MPRISREEANDTLVRITRALEEVKIDTIKAADDEIIDQFVSEIREHFERYALAVVDVDDWVEGYKQRMKEAAE